MLSIEDFPLPAQQIPVALLGLPLHLARSVQEYAATYARQAIAEWVAAQLQPAQPLGEQAVGYALAMRVLQSDLYGLLDDTERAECDAMLATQPLAVPGGADEMAWLIETPGYQGAINYLAAQGSYLCYTASADLALRFARKADAEALFEVYAHGKGLSGNHRWREVFKFTEHMWPDSTPKPTPAPQGEQREAQPVARIDSMPSLERDGLYRAEITITHKLPQFTDLYTAPPTSVLAPSEGAGVTLTEAQILAVWRQVAPGCDGLKVTRDVGPYEVTELTSLAIRFVHAVLAAASPLPQVSEQASGKAQQAAEPSHKVEFLEDVYEQCCAAIKPYVDRGLLPGSVVDSLDILLKQLDAPPETPAAQQVGEALDIDTAIRIWHKHCDSFKSVLGNSPASVTIDAMLEFATLAAQPAPVAAHQPAASEGEALALSMREVLEYQSAAASPSIHDFGRWRRALDAWNRAQPPTEQASDKGDAPTDAEIEAMVYEKCPHFGDAHDGISMDELIAVVRAALTSSRGSRP